MADSIVDDRLWDDFHRVVNMTSADLRAWPAVQGGEETEELPGLAGSHDVDVMEQVVERVTSQRREDLEPTAGEAAWRRRLMNVGHDPLRPV